MRIITIKGVTYADYQDGTVPVRCDNLYQAFARAFEKRSVDSVLGHAVARHSEAPKTLLGEGKKKITITIGG